MELRYLTIICSARPHKHRKIVRVEASRVAAVPAITTAKAVETASEPIAAAGVALMTS